jgi:hypothetical protein
MPYSMDEILVGSPQNEEPVAMGRSAPASCSSSKNGLSKPYQGRSIPSLQCQPATVPHIMKKRQTENTSDRRKKR